ncbi:MAG: hypothetical protein ACK5KR_06045 [Breznakia sp.]
MFQKGDIVLYRLNISSIFDIERVDGKKYYVLHSLEVDNCTYKVPIENAFHSIVDFPSIKRMEALFTGLKDVEIVCIKRTMVDKCCKPIIHSIDLPAWLGLLKSLYYDKCGAQKAGKKFPEKSKYYYDFILHRFAAIYSHMKAIHVDDSAHYVENVLKMSCDNL